MTSPWFWLGFALLAASPAAAQSDPAKTYREAPAVAARYPDPPVD